MLKRLSVIVFAVTLSMVFSVQGYGFDMPTKTKKMEHKGGGHGMMMHHQHMMLNHALSMNLEGTNLVMLGSMGMAEGVDAVSIEHGKMMVKHGRTMWNDMMSGDAMMKMHSDGAAPDKDPMMKYTHKLGEAQLKVMDLLAEMGSDKESHEGHGMVMHHQHMMLIHALKMALEGSNMVMTGKMGMAKGIDKATVQHGKMMIKHAKSLFNDVMSGDAMMKMHSDGKSPSDDKHMAYTHKLGEAMMKVMNTLSMMPKHSK